MHYANLPQLLLIASSLHALITPNVVVGFSPNTLRYDLNRPRTTTPRSQASHLPVHAATNTNDNDTIETSSSSSRRFFLEKAYLTAAATAVPLLLSPDNALAAAATASEKKVLVLGGTGFVGAEVCRQLTALQIPYVATSTDGRSGTVPLNVLAPNVNVPVEIESLAKGCTAVISCIGAIGSKDDKSINAATGLASIGATNVGVQNFVYIGVAPEVRKSAVGVGFLGGYLDGKAFSEETIIDNFSAGKKGMSKDGFTLIQPTFIYGGDTFALSPPRVADWYGSKVEGLLSSGLFRTAAGAAPGIVGIALEPPVKVGAVARAAVAGALGLSDVRALDTYDKINAAAGLL